MVKNLPATAGDVRDANLIPGLRRSPKGRKGNTLQCSCLENPMDRGTWEAAVHRVAQIRTAFAVFHGFWIVVFCFHLSLGNFSISSLISSVTHWFLSSILFSLHLFVCVCVFFFFFYSFLICSGFLVS